MCLEVLMQECKPDNHAERGSFQVMIWIAESAGVTLEFDKRSERWTTEFHEDNVRGNVQPETAVVLLRMIRRLRLQELRRLTGRYAAYVTNGKGEPLKRNVVDPNAVLRQILELAELLISPRNDHEDHCGMIQDGERLAELVTALDVRLCRGGSLPSRWADPLLAYIKKEMTGRDNANGGQQRDKAAR